MSKNHLTGFFEAASLFARFAKESSLADNAAAHTDQAAHFTDPAAHFANKKPLAEPHPDRTEGHWITENGSHIFVDKDGNHFPPGQHPQDKTHRNVMVPVHPDLFNRLGIDPAQVKADYIKLDAKHQDQFAGPDDVKLHVEHVMSAPTHVLQGEPGHILLVRRDATDKAAILDMALSGARPDSRRPGKTFGGSYNIRSAYTLDPGQLETKIANAGRTWSVDFSKTGNGEGLELSAGGSHTSGPASKTLRSSPKTFRRQLCLGGTVPSRAQAPDTDSADTSIIPQPSLTPRESSAPQMPSPRSLSLLARFAEFSLEEFGRLSARAATNPAPTPAQVQRGNYAKGRFAWNGLKIAIENPAGSLREGVNARGVPWRTRMTCDYGYFTEYGGADGDRLDVLIGPDLLQDKVFVVDQKDVNGDFDEAKVVIGCTDIAEAHALYLSNYQEGWEVNIQNITPLTLTEFKAWLERGEGEQSRSVFQGSAEPTRKAIEAARRERVNASDTFCPDCGAVYEWADAGERDEEQGACNRCGSHHPPVEGKLALGGDFFADFSRADFNAGEFVTVPALISRAGNYADKGIELTRADFDRTARMVSPESPISMNLAHLRRGSVLDDAGLGQIQRTWRRGDELWGEIAVPKWLASLARDRGLRLPVSAEWDIKTKTLRGCAWERTPRIGDARAVI